MVVTSACWPLVDLDGSEVPGVREEEETRSPGLDIAASVRNGILPTAEKAPQASLEGLVLALIGCGSCCKEWRTNFLEGMTLCRCLS